MLVPRQWTCGIAVWQQASELGVGFAPYEVLSMSNSSMMKEPEHKKSVTHGAFGVISSGREKEWLGWRPLPLRGLLLQRCELPPFSFPMGPSFPTVSL